MSEVKAVSETQTIENTEVKNLKNRCSNCKYCEETDDALGVIRYCSSERCRQLAIDALNQLGVNIRELYNVAGFISHETYKAVTTGFNKDIEFVQDYGVLISDFAYGRKCFEQKEVE